MSNPPPQPKFDIEVENLTKRFGDFVAVDSISFKVGHGEVFGLLGPNGAGKSTLIRMMTTLVPPTSGTVSINGFDVVRSPNQVRQSIGVIPQAMTSDVDLSAEENMSIFAKLYGIPRVKRRRMPPENIFTGLSAHFSRSTSFNNCRMVLSRFSRGMP